MTNATNATLDSPGPVLLFLTYLRAVISGALFIALTFAFSTLVLVSSIVGLRRVADLSILLWAQLVLFVFAIKTKVFGRENLDPKVGYLYLFNHQSHLDIPLIYSAVRGSVRFGAKAELFKIPVFGQAIRAAGTLPIARENRNEVLRVYRAVEKNFSMGLSYVLAPEGTRQPEPRIGRFKKTPFFFAINAKAAIVPVVIKGAYELLPKSRLAVNVGRWSGQAKISFLPPVETSRMRPEDAPVLAEKIHAMMEREFERL